MSHGQHLPSPAPTPFPGAPPEDPHIRATLEKELQRLAQDLYEMEVCAGEVVTGMEGQVAERLEKVNKALVELTRLAPQVTDTVPRQIIEHIDKTKNPHQYTKTALSRATGENQYALGRALGLESFRRQLETGLSDAFPDLPLPERRHQPIGVENGDGEGGSGDTDVAVDGEGDGAGEMAGFKAEGAGDGAEVSATGEGEETAAEPAGSVKLEGIEVTETKAAMETEAATGMETETAQETEAAAGPETETAGETEPRTQAELGESVNGDSKPAV